MSGDAANDLPPDGDTPKPSGKPNGHAQDHADGHDGGCDEAVDFLKRFHSGSRYSLAAIRPDVPKGAIEGRSFGQADRVSAQQWIAERNGHVNLYHHLNVVRPGFRRPKAARKDIVQVGHLHVDVDPRDSCPRDDERKRIHHSLTDGLPPGVPRPTWIIDSGNGYQAFWRLEQPFDIGGDESKAEEIERYTRQLAAIFGGDKCHSIEHLMRLPGTTNLPDAKKRKKGRVKAIASVVEFNDIAYPLSVFTPAASKTSADSERGDPAGDDEAQPAELGDLDKWGVPERVKIIIEKGHVPDEPKTGDDSRSAWLWDAICNLLRCKVPRVIILSIIMDPRFGISASVLDHGGKAKEYALKQIDKALDQVALDEDSFVPDAKDHTKKAGNNQHNIRLASRKLGVQLGYDIFRGRYVITGLEGVGPLLDDAAMDRLYLTIDERFRFRPAREYFETVIRDAARRASFHPVRDYLDSLLWDRKPRLDEWLSRYGGADNTAYTRTVGALVLTAAVRRVRQPGCKFDEMLVLESDQGTNKSSALALLAVRDEFFSDDLPLNADGKRVIEALGGRWIVEAGELKGMRQGDVEHLKSFLSRPVDKARLSYERMPTEVPRQCVIIGTTNSSRYLRDGTGARRFWPVRVSKFDLDALRQDRDQLWAEAAHREAEGDSIRMDPTLYADAAIEQEARRVEDPFVSAIKAVLGEMKGKLLNEDAWTVLGIPVRQRTQEHNARLGEAMKELGWERIKLRFGAKHPEWCYARGTAEERKRRVRVSRDPSNDTAMAAYETEPM